MEYERIKVKINFFISLYTSRYSHFISQILRNNLRTMSTIKSTCLFKFCGAKIHGEEECLGSAQRFYEKKYYGETYNVCPKCLTASKNSFEEFLIEHRTHLSYFTKSKLDIIKNGNLFIYF